MRPVLAIATRNILPNEDDDRDDVDDGACLNLLPTGSGTHFPKEKKKNTKKSHRKLEWWRGILLRTSLPQLLHYLVTFFLSLILLSILVLRPRSGAQAIVWYVLIPHIIQLTQFRLAQSPISLALADICAGTAVRTPSPASSTVSSSQANRAT